MCFGQLLFTSKAINKQPLCLFIYLLMFDLDNRIQPMSDYDFRTPSPVIKVPFVSSSFYRHVLEPEVVFQADGSFSLGPLAKFLDMPQSPLFTLNLNTPETWMVESVHTRYDLDNIYLEEVKFVWVSIWMCTCELFKRVSRSELWSYRPTPSCPLNVLILCVLLCDISQGLNTVPLDLNKLILFCSDFKLSSGIYLSFYLSKGLYKDLFFPTCFFLNFLLQYSTYFQQKDNFHWGQGSFAEDNSCVSILGFIHVKILRLSFGYTIKHCIHLILLHYVNIFRA